MADSGGTSTFEGIKYEIQFGVYKLLDILNGNIVTLRYQPPTTALSSTQIPNEIYIEDYSTQEKNGEKLFFQAKSNSKDNSWTIKRLITEKVLTQMFKQHQNEPNSTLIFVSDTPSKALGRVADQAKKSLSTIEFDKILTKETRQYTQQIVSSLKINFQEIWELLRHVETLWLTEQQIQDRITDYASYRYGDSTKFKFVLKDIIENTAGSIITKDLVVDRLTKFGLFELPESLNADVKTIFKQASGSLRAYKSDIIGIHIEREETQKLENWIKNTTDNPPIAFLLDTAGTGKSVILHDLLVKLESQNIPVLAIKADILPNISSQNMLMEQLGLPSPPESLLALAAKNSVVVLIIDQLDALSLTFSRNQDTLNIINGLIGRIVSISNVKVIVSCRSFDRQFDPKLKQINSKFYLPIAPLIKGQIQMVLDQLKMQYDSLTQRERQLLSNPHYLETFVNIVQEERQRGLVWQPVNTIQDLYSKLWDIKILSPQVNNISTDRLQNALYTLVDAINRNHELIRPSSLFDSFAEEVKYLKSEGIFIHQNNSIMFFHQSFFDYCFARRMASESSSFAEYILVRDQGFFYRPQIVQVLTYLRAVDRKRYYKELEALIDIYNNPAGGKILRYHLRQVVFTFFGQQTNLDPREKAIGLKCLQSHINRRLFTLGAFGNAEWFDVINPQINLDTLDDEILNTEIIPFYRSIQEYRSEEIFGLFHERLGKSEIWDSRIIWYLQTFKGWQCQNAQKCLIWLLNNSHHPWYSLDLALHNIAEANPDFGLQTLSIILERLVNQWLKLEKPIFTDNTKDSATLNEKEKYLKSFEQYNTFQKYVKQLFPENIYWLEDLIQHIASEYPAKLLDILLPWLNEILPKLTWNSSSDYWLYDALFSYSFDRHPHHPNSEIIDGVRLALKQLAISDSEIFLRYASEIERSRYFILHNVLVEILIENASQYASWSLKYLLKDPLRFHSGDMASPTLYSRKLIGKIFPFLNPGERAQLEKTIFAYYPKSENRIDTLIFRGSDQLELLWEVPDSILTNKGIKLRSQLKLKFPNYKPHEGNDYELKAMSSPIPIDRIPLVSDKGWLDAMHHFDDNTDWDKPKKGFLKGGVIELSRAMQDFVKSNPERFLKLLKRFDTKTSSQYFGAVLNGLAESKIDSITVFGACEYSYYQRPDDILIQRAICDVIEKRLDSNISQSTIDIIQKIALGSTDPDHEEWQTEAGNGNYYHNGDPHSNGINTARGSAVRVYMQFAVKDYIPIGKSTIAVIDKFACDPSTAVRSCLIEFLPYVTKLDKDYSVKIFQKAIKDHPELLENRVSYNFIHYALNHNTSDMFQYIEFLSQGKSEESHEVAGRLATITYLINNKYDDLYLRCIEGDSHTRKGVTAVFARNVDQPKLLSICIDGLSKLMYDKEKSIREQVGQVFEYLPPPDGNVQHFINNFLNSEMLEESARYCMSYAEKIQFGYPQISLLIAEKIIEKFNKDVVDFQKAAGLLDDNLVNLAVSIQTHNDDIKIKARAMDLFEQVMDLGSHYAQKVLEQVDR